MEEQMRAEGRAKTETVLRNEESSLKGQLNEIRQWKESDKTFIASRVSEYFFKVGSRLSVIS